MHVTYVSGQVMPVSKLFQTHITFEALGHVVAISHVSVKVALLLDFLSADRTRVPIVFAVHQINMGLHVGGGRKVFSALPALV